MAAKRSKMWVSVLFLLGLLGCFLIYYVSGPALQARQILTDVQRYQKGNGSSPSVAQLRDQSAMYRNLKGRCPCYKPIGADFFRLQYTNVLGQTYVMETSKSMGWVQFKSN